MSGLLKLLPLMTIGSLCYMNADLLDKGMALINNVQVDTTVNVEINNIGRALRLYYLETNTLPLDDFSKWLAENMTEEGGKRTRDRTKDMWGTPYRIERRENGFAVMSAGPDRAWGTADDIVGVYGLDDQGGDHPPAASPGPASSGTPPPSGAPQPPPPKKGYQWKRS